MISSLMQLVRYEYEIFESFLERFTNLMVLEYLVMTPLKKTILRHSWSHGYKSKVICAFNFI
jgi:hypothetical protein